VTQVFFMALIFFKEPGEFMFFIVLGEIEVAVEPEPVRLGTGEFFGEIALVEKVARSADVVAHTQAQLFVLDRTGSDQFLASEPDVPQAITEVARTVRNVRPRQAGPHAPPRRVTRPRDRPQVCGWRVVVPPYG